MPSRNSELCALCDEGRLSTRSGEHVWPTWFLKRFPDTDGPYTLLKNGEPQRNRDGGAVTHSSIARVNLPACEVCNPELQRRFETNAKEPIRRMLDADGSIVLPAPEADAVSLWFVKTLMLLAHPRAEHSQLGGAMFPWDDPIEPDLYSWMVDGAAPPDYVSLWVQRPAGDSKIRSDTEYMPLPTVHAGAERYVSRHRQVGLGSLQFHVMVHPVWTVEHPLEATGQAIRLFPRESVDLDLNLLQACDGSALHWSGGPTLGFDPEWFDPTTLPPLSPSTRFELGEIMGLRSMAFGS